LPAVFAGLAFFRAAGRSGVFLATFFRIVLILLTVFLRVALLTRVFFALCFALFCRRHCSLLDAKLHL
jgi:hypothetical protein